MIITKHLRHLFGAIKRNAVMGLSLSALFACIGTGPAKAQLAEFNVCNHPIVIHGFLSEGFMKSDGNNFITAKTGNGTFQNTEGAINIATQLTDKLHVGAQVYSGRTGRLGEYTPRLDWAYADYRVTDWLGFRGGKVKTPLGLYNDTQDMEFLHPWILLPQSMYPNDLRSMTLAHTGGDAYGRISLKKLGSLSYQVYGGERPTDMNSGFAYGLEEQGFSKLNISGYNTGYDVKWSTPIKGLRVGTSYMYSYYHIDGFQGRYPGYSEGTYIQTAGYAEYQHKGLSLASEFRSEPSNMALVMAGHPLPNRLSQYTMFFASAAYRFTPWLQIGTYNSRFLHSSEPVPGLLPGDNSHIFDQAVTVRFDFKKYWTFKIEGHFMDGVGTPISAHGFYLTDNPQGLKPTTNMIALRLGFNI
jgi:hypothetical protein